MGDEHAKFHEFLQRMVKETHNRSGFNREEYVALVNEISDYYGITKGVTEFYINVDRERKGDGETFCDVERPGADKLAMEIRIETATKAVVKGLLYVPEDRADFTEQEKNELDLLLGLILSFLSRIRLVRTVEQFVFTDDDGYPNFRAFARHIIMKNETRSLPDMLVVHLDLHNFSMVNQEVGRENGNMVMRNFYLTIKKIAGEEGFVGRLGGDKFLGLFPPQAEKELLEVLSGTPILYSDGGDRKIIVSASAGIFRIPEGFVFRHRGDIMEKTMVASAVAKRSEEGAIVFYDDKLLSMNERVKWVQSQFRMALTAEEFKVFYQPKVNVETREIVGAEALCRWFHEGRMIPPLEFIPILEQNMDICDLDFYMLEHVCRDIRRRRDEGRHVVRVSVNLSRKHLVDVDLQQHIMEIIDRYEIPHNLIEIELTETTTDVHFRDLKQVVNDLQAEGVSMAVDDFGIGYSSLNLIREIPWDVLKIDRCFLPVDEEHSDSITSVMFKHVVSLAQDLGIECVVEGVETKKQVEMLRSNLCNIAQGFYFDRPLPAEDFERKLDLGNYD